LIFKNSKQSFPESAILFQTFNLKQLTAFVAPVLNVVAKIALSLNFRLMGQKSFGVGSAGPSQEMLSIFTAGCLVYPSVTSHAVIYKVDT
jgi:hypothetical protein